MPFRGEVVVFDGSLYLPLAGGTMSGSIAVNAANSYDLGSSTNYWRAVYAQKLDLTGALIVGTIDATAVTIGRAPITTTIAGTVVIGEATTTQQLKGTAVIGDAATTSQVLGTLRYDNTDVNATAGAIVTPGNYDGFLVINVGGATKKVPYFAN